jgi:mono/diheme cytochrome c family protein
MRPSMKVLGVSALVGTLGVTIWALARPGPADDVDPIARGRYIAQIAGCNDCHTAGYAESGGNVPEGNWLLGTPLGWRGDWGTTYAANLRLYMQRLTEDEWIAAARHTKLRPPMPWFALRDMEEPDLRAFYRFVRHLGPAGEAAPAYLPPNAAPQGPVVEFPRASPVPPEVP